MIYKGCEIKASAATWSYYSVNDDGTLGSHEFSGELDLENIDYDVYRVSDDELLDGSYESVEDAKKFIDRYMTTKIEVSNES